jgi:hypothetical protein
MLALSTLVFNAVRAHEHDEELTEEAAQAAVDSILWVHIFLQAAVWGILFPIGMVFGISRSRWHVPLQVCPHPHPHRASAHPSVPPSYLPFLTYRSFFDRLLTTTIPHWRTETPFRTPLLL